MDRTAKRLDYTLMILVLFLVGFGLVMLYSTSAYNGQVKFDDSASQILEVKAQATIASFSLLPFCVLNTLFIFSYEKGLGI